jgi:sortase A
VSQQPPPPPGRGDPWQQPDGQRRVPRPGGDHATEFIPRVEVPREDSPPSGAPRVDPSRPEAPGATPTGATASGGTPSTNTPSGAKPSDAETLRAKSPRPAVPRPSTPAPGSAVPDSAVPGAMGPAAAGPGTPGSGVPRAGGPRHRAAPAHDETVFIPRIEDFGAVPQGRSDDARRAQPQPDYPKQDPDLYGGLQGTFNRRPAGMDDRTEIMNFGGPNGGLPTAMLAGGPGDQPPAAKVGGRTFAHTLGEVLITAGMVVLLFVVYELYITNIFSAQKQANATTALDKEWDTVTTGPQRTTHYDLNDGAGIAKLYIPALGSDFHFTVIEGTNPDDLAIGPGHYVGTSLPGQPGNFAVAGHRVGEGAPFNDLDLVQSCDAIVVESQTDWFVYRMLPMTSEQAGWATGKGKTAQCDGIDGEGKVAPLGGLYAKTPGQEIVLPSEGDVVAPVPHYPNAKVSTGQEASLLTLTTCHPKFSDKQRMILHAVLTKDYKKDPAHPNQSPPELKETS